jgi:hypothetical protein
MSQNSGKIAQKENGGIVIIKLNIDGVDYACTPSNGFLLVPSWITPTVVNLDALTGWSGEKDAGTKGTAVGTSAYPVNVGGRIARSFPSDYTNYGGMRYHCNYATDMNSHNFVYAGDLWFDDPAPLGQMELDNNQVTADGRTYIFGCQANNNDGAWDVTEAISASQWVITPAKGCPKTWPAKQWMHFEIASHRDDAGNVTYDAVHFNGATQAIGMTLPASLMLNWKRGDCVVNWQENGALPGAGSIRAYGSNTRVARW